MNEIVEKVCPSASELSREACKNITCPVPGCKKVLLHLSALRFHKIKVHGMLENETDRRIYRRQKSRDSKVSTAVLYQYICPCSDCIYSLNGLKYFTTFKLLKQHYMKVHAAKLHVCEACEASFGLPYDLSRHLKTCRLYHSSQLDIWHDTPADDDIGKPPDDTTAESTSKDLTTSLVSNESSLDVFDVTSSAPSDFEHGGVIISRHRKPKRSAPLKTKKVASSKNRTVRNSLLEPAPLLPKLNAFLVPMLLPVIVMPMSAGPRLKPIAPKTVALNNCVGQCTRQNAVSTSIATQCSRSTGGLCRKAAETQTVSSVGQPDHSAKYRRKEQTKGFSHVSSRSNARKYRALCHSHTQTHGTHLICPTTSVSSDMMSNATQTVDKGLLESTRTQTVESYLSHSELFDASTWLPITADLSQSRDENCVGDVVLKPSNGVEYQGDRGAEVELFDSSRDVSEQFDRLLGELVEESTPRPSLTSASQTVSIDLDAVSTQTMDCDFDTGYFDLSNTETQTDLLDVLFGFSDIETQTAHQLQLWDSETQTCFDSLL